MGAIAAWDGIAVKVERPCYKDAYNQNKFWCRKGFPAVSVQAACDADRRFSYFSLEFAGSVHDSRAYRLARTRCGGFICREMAASETLRMQGDDQPHGFFVLGNDAYPYSDHMCVPWSRVGSRPARDAFNYHQSRGRINVECSFGMLVKKFLVLGRPMMCALPRVQLVVRVSMKLHSAQRRTSNPPMHKPGLALTPQPSPLHRRVHRRPPRAARHPQQRLHRGSRHGVRVCRGAPRLRRHPDALQLGHAPRRRDLVFGVGGAGLGGRGCARRPGAQSHRPGRRPSPGAH